MYTGCIQGPDSGCFLEYPMYSGWGLSPWGLAQIAKGWGGFVGGFRFMSQWRQKFGYKEKKKKKRERERDWSDMEFSFFW